MPAISQREIISFLAFITPMGLILFTDRLDGLDAPSVSHTEIKTRAQISPWHGMNLLTYLANYGAYVLKSITFPPSPFAISPSLPSHHYINPAHLPTRPPLWFSLPGNYLTLSGLLASLCNSTVWPYTSPPSSSIFSSVLYDPWWSPSVSFPPLPFSSSHFPKSLPIPPCLLASALWSMWHFNSHAGHLKQRGALPSIHNPREQRSH